MKKIFLIAGMAALLVSCANQETVEMAQTNAIEFNAYVGKATRADVTAANLTGFDVYGYYGDNTEVFDGVAVTKSGSNWVISGQTAYWVANQVYNFAAVAPSSTSASFSTNGLVLSDYTPSGDDDLIVAVTNPITSKASGNEAVQLNFKHALAKVQLKLENVGDQSVSDVKLNGVVSKGTLTATNDAGVELSWAAGTDNQSYNYTLASNTGALYVIPQTIGDNVKVSLTVGATTKEFTVKQANVGEWETGHVYTYTIDLTPEQEKIEIEVGEVDEWDDTLPEPEEPAEPEELTGAIYIDFGNRSTDNTDAQWNHLRSAELSEETLKYEDGETDSPLKISTTGLTVYAGAGGESNDMTSSEILWPVGVWADGFQVNGTTPGVITISGLNQNQKVDITVISARFNGGIEARQTHITVGQETADIKQGIKLDSSNYLNWSSVPYDNFSHIFTNVSPSDEGTIEISVIGTQNIASDDGHINAMVISPVQN